MYSPEVKARIELLTKRSLEGTITMEERREAIALLRDGRIAVQSAAKQSAKRKAQSAPQINVDLDNLFD